MAGNTRAPATVRLPTPEEEQKRAASRQREQVQREVQRVAAQGRGLLLTRGHREKKGWWEGKRWAIARQMAADLWRRRTGRMKPGESGWVMAGAGA